LAHLPNLRVPIVSASFKLEGEQVMIRQFFELPPRDSYRMWLILIFDRDMGWFSICQGINNQTENRQRVIDFFALSYAWLFAPVLLAFSESPNQPSKVFQFLLNGQICYANS